jgi:hypothetical protein
MRIKPGTAILLIVFLLTLCKREPDNYESKGTIIGPDLRDCACCGGWYIKIDTTEYEFDSLPNETDIDLLKDTFPIKVKLDWELSDRMPCPYKWVIITRIIKE